MRCLVAEIESTLNHLRNIICHASFSFQRHSITNFAAQPSTTSSPSSSLASLALFMHARGHGLIWVQDIARQWEKKNFPAWWYIFQWGPCQLLTVAANVIKNSIMAMIVLFICWFSELKSYNDGSLLVFCIDVFVGKRLVDEEWLMKKLFKV